jgi:hypothetical protein
VVRRGGGSPSAPPCPERRRVELCSFSFFFSGSNSDGSGGLVLDFRNLVLRIWSLVVVMVGLVEVRRSVGVSVDSDDDVFSGGYGGCTLSRWLSCLLGWP